LLAQIRGQQSALSLLIQGLQMESIADIRKLVEQNSVTLDQVVKRSRTLRQSHPRVLVPESLFNQSLSNQRTNIEDAADAESIAKSVEFTFDDEVINSRAYRRAMALYTSNTAVKERQALDPEVEQDEPPAYEASQNVDNDEKRSDIAQDTLDKVHSSEALDQRKPGEPRPGPIESAFVDELRDAFDSIEKDYLPYMPRITATAPYLTPLRANTSIESTLQVGMPQHRAPLRSHSEGDLLVTSQDAPPLPPRRPSGPQPRSEISLSGAGKASPVSSNDSTYSSTAPTTLSKVPTLSSHPSHEPMDSTIIMARKPIRKPLPLSHQVSHDVLGILRKISTTPLANSESSLRNAEMHSIWLSLIDSEHQFIERMSRFRKMFYDNVVKSWPLLEDHIEAIVIGERLSTINNDLLLQVMESQVLDNDDATCDPSIFEEYASKAHKTYREYCQRMPHAFSSLRTTQTRDPRFNPFVNTLGLSIFWFGKGWEDYMKLPLSHLEVYFETLQKLISVAELSTDFTADREVARLRRAGEVVQWLKTTTSGLFEDAQSREDVQNLQKRIHTLDSNIFSQLHLLDSDRRIRHQGNMAIKMKGQGPWQAVHVMLLDNFLLWGKVKPQKTTKGDKVMVLDAPIAVDRLEVASSCEQHQFQKATMFDDIPRGSVVYIISVKNRDVDSKPHMLGAFGYQEQKEWLKQLTSATTVPEEVNK
jgi:hypothetical protein